MQLRKVKYANVNELVANVKIFSSWKNNKLTEYMFTTVMNLWLIPILIIKKKLLEKISWDLFTCLIPHWGALDLDQSFVFNTDKVAFGEMLMLMKIIILWCVSVSERWPTAD